VRLGGEVSGDQEVLWQEIDCFLSLSLCRHNPGVFSKGRLCSAALSIRSAAGRLAGH
jgi:hypothetical protein